MDEGEVFIAALLFVLGVIKWSVIVLIVGAVVWPIIERAYPWSMETRQGWAWQDFVKRTQGWSHNERSRYLSQSRGAVKLQRKLSERERRGEDIDRAAIMEAAKTEAEQIRYEQGPSAARNFLAWAGNAGDYELFDTDVREMREKRNAAIAKKAIASHKPDQQEQEDFLASLLVR